MFISKAWRQSTGWRAGRPHTNLPITTGTVRPGSCSAPLLPGIVQRARPAWGASSMPSGCLGGGRFSLPWDTPDLPRLHQITMAARYSWLGPSTQGHSPQLTAGWGAAGGEGPWSPKVEPLFPSIQLVSRCSTEIVLTESRMSFFLFLRNVLLTFLHHLPSG